MLSAKFGNGYLSQIISLFNIWKSSCILVPFPFFTITKGEAQVEFERLISLGSLVEESEIPSTILCSDLS